jgi:PAS domain S-box-containing protein
MINTLATPVGNEAKPGRSNQYAISARNPLLVFIFFSLAIMAGGYFVFQYYKINIRNEKQAELGGIAELKIRQIITWMEERRGDAQALKEDPLFMSAVGDWLQRGGPVGDARAKLAARLSSMQQADAAYGYTSISLFDDQAILRLSSAADEAPLHGHEKERLLESMRSGQIVFSEIHREIFKSGERVEIELRVPLIQVNNGKSRTIGAVLFRIDPNLFLFPLIQRWPTLSASAENLLVRRDGDEVVFLNELRLRKNSPLALRMPLSNRELPAVMAALGQEGVVEGVDYRGVPVVGVLSNVPGTSWAMVSKIDKAEIYAPINQLADWMLLLMLALVGTGGGIAVFWRKKEKRQYESELNRHVLVQHLDFLAKYANDIILMTDNMGKIVNFNDRALEAYGYSAKEFSTLNIADLRAIDFTPPFTDRLEEVNRAESLRFESTHVRRNGEAFQVEVSIRIVNYFGESFHQAIIRDITERKQAENELARQKDFIRQVIDSDPSLIFVKDAEGRFLLANEAMAKSYGQTTESIVGKCNSDFVPNSKQAAAYDGANREVIERRQERVAIEAGVLANGEIHCYKTIRKPLLQADGSISVLTVAMDITELHETQERLQINNRALRLLSACNIALVHSVEEGLLLTEICKLIVETGAYHMAWIGMAEHDREKMVRPVARYGRDEGYLDGANISWADRAHGRGPVGIAIITGVTQVNQNFLTNPSMALWREAALERGYQSSIALPLRSGAQAFGVLVIYSAIPDSFNTDEVLLLEELADNLAWGIMALRVRAEHEQAVEKLRQSEEHFRFLTENAANMTYLMSLPEGSYGYVSPSSEHLTGYTPEEFYHSPRLMQDIIHPAWRAYCEERWQNILKGEVDGYFEFQIMHKSGEMRWVNQHNAPIWSGKDSGILIAIQCVVTDITERKLAEVQLENERIRLRTLVQTIPDMVWLKDTDGNYLSCNAPIERLFGAKEADIVGKTDYDFAHAELADHFRQKDREAMAANKPSVNEEWITYSDNGQRVLLETIKMPMRDETGKLIGVMGIARDITERKRAEERESQLRRTLDNTLDMIFMFRPDSLRFVYVNKGGLDSIGYSNDELLLMTPLDIKPLLSEPEFRQLVAPLISGEKELLRFETTHRSKSGADLPVEVQLQLVQEQDGGSVFVAIVRDIAERRRAEKELQRQKAFMWQVIDTDPNQIFVKDGKGKFLLVNQSFAAAYGLTPQEVVGKSNAEINIFSAEVEGYLEADRRVIEEEGEITLVEPFSLPDGEQRWFLTIKKRLTMPDGSLNVLGIAVDITRQRLSEMKLAESYKELQRLSLHLENVRGDERAKIALNLHDEMGATLVAIKMGIAWLASKLPADAPQLLDEAAHITELVSGGIHTMREIVTQLRPSLLDDVGFVAALKDYVKKFRQQTNIECILSLPEKEFVLNADQSLTLFRIIQESLNNVAKHAQASKVNIHFIDSGDALLMVVRDDGIGFDTAVQKENSHGLLGIRERALMVGGQARISSSSGKGSSVSVSLPRLNYPDSHDA